MSDDQEDSALEAATQPNQSPLNKLVQLEATPGFEKTLHLLRNLSEYDDLEPGFLEEFPENLPRRFQLMLGPTVIGNATVDWKAVIAKLFDTCVAGINPKGLSEE